MRVSAYVVGFVRVLFGIGLSGFIAFLFAVAVGIGWKADWIPVRAALNPTFKAWAGIDMPQTLPWLFIGASFVLIALVRLVHRHVMWEATLPHLKFSKPRLTWTVLSWTEPRAPHPMPQSNSVALGYVEVCNVPRTRIGALAAEKAWAKATFTNLETGEMKEVRFCRWTDNPKPRSDEHMTELPVRFNSDWNRRDLEPNAIPNRLDFFIFHLAGRPYAFCGLQQEFPDGLTKAMSFGSMPLYKLICISTP